MSLPRALNMALSRFEHSKEAIRVLPTSKLTFGDSEQIVFKLPTSGVIDTYNLSLVGNFLLNASANIAPGGLSVAFGAAISRFEVLAGGTTIFGAGASDFSTAYMARKMIAEPGYVQASSNRVYDQVLNSAQVNANPALSVPLIMSDMPGLCFKNCRFLPLAAFPEIEVRITIQSSRLNLPSGCTFTSVSPYLLMSKISIPGEFSVESLVAKRLSMGTPIELAYENWTTQTGAPITSEGAVPYSISTQSLDYMIHLWRDATRTNPGGGGYHASTTMGAEARYQVEVNNVPLSSWQMTSTDVWWKMSEALDAGQNNLLVDPQVKDLTEWTTSKFALVERFSFPTVDSAEARSLISGLNTQGQTVPIRVSAFGGSGTRTPTAVFIHTSTVELSPGRVLTVIN